MTILYWIAIFQIWLALGQWPNRWIGFQCLYLYVICHLWIGVLPGTLSNTIWDILYNDVGIHSWISAPYNASQPKKGNTSSNSENIVETSSSYLIYSYWKESIDSYHFPLCSHFNFLVVEWFQTSTTVFNFSTISIIDA